MSKRLREHNCGELHLFLLKLTSLLPFDGRSLNFPGTIILCVYVHWSHLVVTSMFIGNVIMTFLKGDECDIENISETVGLCGVAMRFFVMFSNRAKISTVVHESKKLWNELEDHELDMIRSFVNKSLRLTYIYLVAHVAMLAFYLVASQLPAAYSLNTTATTRSLPYSFYTDVQVTPWYELAVTVQMLSMTGISLSTCGVDTAAPFFIMIVCGHLRSLCSRLQKLASIVECDDNHGQQQDDKVDVVKNMIECIVYHQKLIMFCKDVESLTKLLYMVQLISTTYNMSLIGLKLVGDDPDKMKYLTVLSLLMCQLFMCQWAPDLLISECKSLAKSAYFIPTYSDKESKKLSKLIHILLMRAQRPVQLTAGGWVTLSMERFGSMITSAMSFFTVLRSIN